MSRLFYVSLMEVYSNFIHWQLWGYFKTAWKKTLNKFKLNLNGDKKSFNIIIGCGKMVLEHSNFNFLLKSFQARKTFSYLISKRKLSNKVVARSSSLLFHLSQFQFMDFQSSTYSYVMLTHTYFMNTYYDLRLPKSISCWRWKEASYISIIKIYILIHNVLAIRRKSSCHADAAVAACRYDC